MNKLKQFFYRNRRYRVEERDGLNVLVETEKSKARRRDRCEVINMFFTVVSAVSAVIAAVFAALAYINS